MKLKNMDFFRFIIMILIVCAITCWTASCKKNSGPAGPQAAPATATATPTATPKVLISARIEINETNSTVDYYVNIYYNDVFYENAAVTIADVSALQTPVVIPNPYYQLTGYPLSTGTAGNAFEVNALIEGKQYTGQAAAVGGFYMPADGSYISIQYHVNPECYIFLNSNIWWEGHLSWPTTSLTGITDPGTYFISVFDENCRTSGTAGFFAGADSTSAICIKSSANYSLTR